MMLKSHSEILDQPYFEQQYHFVAPCKALADWVAFYWQLDLRKGHTNNQAYSEHIFANLHTSVVFNLGSSFGVKIGHTQETYNHSVLIGQHTQCVQYHHHHGNYLVGIKFKPAGINRLLAIPASELPNRIVALNQLFYRSSMEEQLAETNSFNQQASVLDQFLIRHFNLHQTPNYKAFLVKKALEELVQKQQLYRVADIAHQLHTTKRSLERYFDAALGVNPKQCINITRFREALKVYGTQGAKADLESFGYYDFSHFMKDYRKYTS